MSRALWIARGAAEPLAPASDAACDPADRADFGDRAVERRAGAEPAGAQTATTAPPPPSAARVPRCWSRATAATFPQELFVELRRAGWPVSPVLEGRVQIERTLVSAARHRADHDSRGSRQRARDRPSRPAVLPDAAGRDAGRAGRAGRSQSWRKARRRRSATARDCRRCARSAQLVPGVLVVDIGVAQRLLNKPDQISRLLIGKPTGNRAPLESVVGDQLRLVQPDAESDLERLTDSFHLNLTAFGLLSFVVGLFIVNSAIGLAFEQRLPMLRTLRACGVSARMLNSGAGGRAGVAGAGRGPRRAGLRLSDRGRAVAGRRGLVARTLWRADSRAADAASPNGGSPASSSPSPARWPRRPPALRRRSGCRVLAAAQPYAWQQAQHRWLILQSALALAVFAAAGLLLWYGDSLVVGIRRARGAAARRGADPAGDPRSGCCRSASGRPTARSRGWFWADSRQQLSGLSLALMALLLALAVNVGVGTMVETFSRTFVTWLDGRLAADVYVNASDDAQAAEIRTWLRDRPEVAAILPGGRAEVQIGGAPIEVLGIADHAYLSGSLAAAEVRRPTPGHGFAPAMPPSSASNWRGASSSASATPSRCPRPAATGSSRSSASMPTTAIPRARSPSISRRSPAAFPQTPLTRMGLRVWPAANSGADLGAAAEIRARRPQPVDQATLKAESTRIFNRTFAVTAALNAFTLGVAGIALLTSLLTLSNSRLPQLAPLWAIGITRRRLAAIELLKTLSVALITTLLALPLGLLVAWCLIAVVNVKAFGWRLPFACLPAATAAAVGRGDGGFAAGRAAAGGKAGAHAAGAPDQDFRR